MRSAAVLGILIAIGCSHSDGRAARHHAFEVRHARIQRLVTSCSPADQASLVLMATGRFDWGDGVEEAPAETTLDDPRVEPDQLAVRCHATLVLASTPMTTLGRNIGALEKRAQVLSDSKVLEGLHVMLHDVTTGCTGNYGRDAVARTLFPKDAVEDVILMNPIVPTPTGYEDLEAEWAPFREEIERYHPSPRVRRLDESVADLSPASFQKVLEMLDPAYVWNDGNPPPTDEERAEIQKHGLVAMHWALTLAEDAAPPDFEPGRTYYVPNDCEIALYKAIKTGALGDAMRTRTNSRRDEVSDHIDAYLGLLHAFRNPSP